MIILGVFTQSSIYKHISQNPSMIPIDQQKYPKQSLHPQPQSQSQPPKQPSPELLQKSSKLPITKLNLQTIKDLHPACNGTYICVQIAQGGAKRVLHLSGTGKLLGELAIKEAEYQLFVLDQKFVNFVEYTDRKPQARNVQWNLETYESICVNLNREIMPMLKIFAFPESNTFCICQHDHHTQPTPPPNPNPNPTSTSIPSQSPKQQPPGTYHTKFKLSYYKHPLHKTHQKPNIVFKTHTNPKEYGFHQQIIKLNNHSMVGSISNKMDQNDETLLKTFDFRNVAMGIEINYKFHVQIGYRRELLRLWVTDMWELRPEHFYLKCQLRVDKAKEEKLWKAKGKIAGDENVQECLHLTWAYKSENTIKFAKFKTPLLNSIQFLDGFKEKERVRTLYQKMVSKEKVLYSTGTSHLTAPILQPPQLTPSLQPTQISQGSSYPSTQIINLSSTSSTSTSTSSTQQNSSTLYMQPPQKPDPAFIPPIPVTTYTKSLHLLPVYYINNSTEQIVAIDREFSDWLATYPSYYSTMVVYFRQTTQKDNEKIIQVVCQKKREVFGVGELGISMLDGLLAGELDEDLAARIVKLMGNGAEKIREIESGWHCMESSKVYREKSKSNYQSREYKC